MIEIFPRLEVYRKSGKVYADGNLKEANMTNLRRRDDRTYWWNDGPITDIHEALDLLQKQWGDSGKRFISTEDKKGLGFEINLEWYREGSSGGDSSGVDHFDIKPEVVEELVKQGFVEKMRIPEMGYTYTEPYKLVMSQKGQIELERLHEEARRIAHGLLIPGKHSKFSGLFHDAGYGRSGYRGCGRLYYKFRTPQGEKVRVYSDTKEVEKLEEKQ